MRLFSILTMLVVACVVSAAPNKTTKMKWVLADDAPQILQGVINDQPALRAERIKQLEEFIKDFKSRIRDSKDKEMREKMRESIKGAEAEIRSIKADEIIVISSDPPAIIGAVGKVHSMVVDQVVNESEALVTIHYTRVVRRTIYNSQGEQSILVNESAEIQVWAHGFDTKNWIDERMIDIDPHAPMLAYCDSTHKYETVTGASRTIPEIKPFTMAAFKRVPVE